MSEEEKKAIEYLKENIKTDKENIEICEVNDFHEEAKYVSERVKNHEVILNLIEKQDKELETYKKIAEKLTLTILEIDVEEKDVYETICKSTPNNRCEEFGNGNCTQCIMDWARKEVEKDDN